MPRRRSSTRCEAADVALEAHAYEDAAAHYERALVALELARPDDRVARADLLLALGRARWQASERGPRLAFEMAAVAGARPRRAPSASRGRRSGAGGRYYAPGIPDPPYVALLEEALAALEPDDSALRARLLARLAENLVFLEPRDRAILSAREAQRDGAPHRRARRARRRAHEHARGAPAHRATPPNGAGSPRRRSPSPASSMTTSSRRSGGTGSSTTSSSSASWWTRGGAGRSSRRWPTISVSRSTATPHWPGAECGPGWPRGSTRPSGWHTQSVAARRARRRPGRRRPTSPPSCSPSRREQGRLRRAARADRRAPTQATVRWPCTGAPCSPLAHLDAGDVTAARAALTEALSAGVVGDPADDAVALHARRARRGHRRAHGLREAPRRCTRRCCPTPTAWRRPASPAAPDRCNACSAGSRRRWTVPEAAERHLDAALARHEAIGARALTARTQCDLGEILLTGTADARARAAALLADAAAAARGSAWPAWPRGPAARFRFAADCLTAMSAPRRGNGGAPTRSRSAAGPVSERAPRRTSGVRRQAIG